MSHFVNDIANSRSYSKNSKYLDSRINSQFDNLPSDNKNLENFLSSHKNIQWQENQN